MSFTENFISAWAERLKKETRFSDLVWIMCKSIAYFQKLFLDYCFDEEIKVNGEIIREYSRDGARPDFYFVDENKQEYIIENKIDDRGDNFEQYRNSFPDAKRAFIANYKEPEREGWKIKMWQNFLLYMGNKIFLETVKVEDFPEDLSITEYEFIREFADYVKPIVNNSAASTALLHAQQAGVTL